MEEIDGRTVQGEVTKDCGEEPGELNRCQVETEARGGPTPCPLLDGRYSGVGGRRPNRSQVRDIDGKSTPDSGADGHCTDGSTRHRGDVVGDERSLPDRTGLGGLKRLTPVTTHSG